METSTTTDLAALEKAAAVAMQKVTGAKLTAASSAGRIQITWTDE